MPPFDLDLWAIKLLEELQVVTDAPHRRALKLWSAAHDIPWWAYNPLGVANAGYLSITQWGGAASTFISLQHGVSVTASWMRSPAAPGLPAALRTTGDLRGLYQAIHDSNWFLYSDRGAEFPLPLNYPEPLWEAATGVEPSLAEPPLSAQMTEDTDAGPDLERAGDEALASHALVEGEVRGILDEVAS